MKVLFIMPWFCRPCAIEKHFNIFLESVSKLGIEPYVAGIKGLSLYKGQHTFIPLQDRSNKYLAATIRRIFPDLINQPDVYNYTLRSSAVKKLLNVIKQEGIELIHSVSYPCTAHMIGYDLKMATGLPWIVQCYDPWSDNIYRGFKTDKYRLKDLEMEKLIATNADAIIHTNTVIKEVWKERYGDSVDNKSYSVPMSYEKCILSKVNNVPNRKDNEIITISYIGKLFSDRNLKDVVEALDIVANKSPSTINMIKIRLVGEVDNYDKNLIENCTNSKVFEKIGYLSQDKLEDYYYSSDAFLVVDSPQSRNVYFPSKLLDYFIHKRYIIGITPKIGVTHDLLIDSGNAFIKNGDTQKLADLLIKLVANHEQLDDFDHNYYLNFTPDKITTHYDIILKTLF